MDEVSIHYLKQLTSSFLNHLWAHSDVLYPIFNIQYLKVHLKVYRTLKYFELHITDQSPFQIWIYVPCITKHSKFYGFPFIRLV